MRRLAGITDGTLLRDKDAGGHGSYKHGDSPGEKFPEVKTGIEGNSSGPDGKNAHFYPGEGGMLFHGTSSPGAKFSDNDSLYLTSEYDEAKGFARGGHNMVDPKDSASVMKYEMKPGKTVSVDSAINDMLENGEPSEESIMQSARDQGARYATHFHPSFDGSKDGFTAVVSLYPKQDIKSIGGWRVGKND